MAGDLDANTSTGTRGCTRDGENPKWLCRRDLLSILWTGRRYHHTIRPLHYTRRIGHYDSEGPQFSRCIWLRALYWTLYRWPPLQTNTPQLPFLHSP